MTPQDGPSSSLDFAFNASGWTDRADDLPLSYLFAYRRVALTRGTTVDALNASAPLVVPLADGGLSHLLQMPLPPGDLRVQLIVSDIHGCSGIPVEADIRAYPDGTWPSAAANAYRGIAASRLAIAVGDADRALTTLHIGGVLLGDTRGGDPLISQVEV